MHNKDLIKLLSGFSMKSEVEVLLKGEIHLVEKVTRVHIPEKKSKDGTTIAARNIVQIVLTDTPQSTLTSNF